MENQGDVKKSKKGKKAKGASKNEASQPVSLLGLDAADAPWANESVPAEAAAQHVTQHPAQTVKIAKQKPSGVKGKRQLEGVKTAAGAPSQDQALALLGYGAAKKPLSQSKKHK